MIVVVCLDEQRGMLFNQRRQTRDKKVIEDLNQMMDTKCYITSFSKDLFDEDKVIISENPWIEAMDGDYFFVENSLLLEHLEKIEMMIIYHWNRKYPTDYCLDIDYPTYFTHVETSEFIGNSHEKITKETWRKNNE